MDIFLLPPLNDKLYLYYWSYYYYYYCLNYIIYFILVSFVRLISFHSRAYILISSETSENFRATRSRIIGDNSLHSHRSKILK
jgi:hypothetical protein